MCQSGKRSQLCGPFHLIISFLSANFLGLSHTHTHDYVGRRKRNGDATISSPTITVQDAVVLSGSWPTSKMERIVCWTSHVGVCHGPGCARKHFDVIGRNVLQQSTFSEFFCLFDAHVVVIAASCKRRDDYRQKCWIKVSWSERNFFVILLNECNVNGGQVKFFWKLAPFTMAVLPTPTAMRRCSLMSRWTSVTNRVITRPLTLVT